MRKQVLLTVALALGVGSCMPGGGGGGGGFFQPPQPQYASGQQIYNTLSNFSVVGAMANGTSYCEYHAPSGQLQGRAAQPYQGTWQVNGNQICYNSQQSGQVNNCQNVLFEGQRASFFTPGGQPVASGNLVGGNVC